jgi:outer membrane protein OmpA-like peptidoglycan-associated protein
VVTETDERPRGFIAQPSLAGSVGLLHMGMASVGTVGQLRLSLHGEFFKGSNFLVQSENPTRSDRDTRLQGALTFGFTPIDHLEIFGAILGSANRNRRLCTSDSDCTPEDNRTDPELIKSFGDLILGGKVAYPVADGFSAAGELGIRLMSSVSGISFSPDSTSFWLNAIGTYDLKPVTGNVPVRFHVNLGYYVDNSSNLVDYTNTSAFSRYVSKFAYGMSGSRFRLALGADAPFDEVAEGLSLRPLLEYHFEYLTNSADSVIYGQEHGDPSNPNCGGIGQTACKDNKDLHWVTLGVQAQVLHGLTLTAGLDIALRSPGYAYAPALVPWNLLFGLGYAIDLVPHVVRTVSVENAVTKEGGMREGLVAGRVINAAGTPIEGAVVGVTGREHARVLTEADGTFQSVPLAPGSVELVVSANGYESATVRTEVVAGQTANIVLRLAAKIPAARVYGRVSDDAGKGVVASLKLAGPQLAETKSDESGNFSAPVGPGLYAVRVDAESYLSKELQVQVAEGRDNALSIVLRPRPAVSGVTFKDGKLKLRQPITFKAGKKPSAELAAGMPLLLDEVVDLLVNHPEIRQMRVEAHWDSSLPPAQAQSLTDDQAKAVVKYLVDQGIAADRLVAAGMGSKKPIVPNLGKGKLKNRRVELVIP